MSAGEVRELLGLLVRLHTLILTLACATAASGVLCLVPLTTTLSLSVMLAAWTGRTWLPSTWYSHTTSASCTKCTTILTKSGTTSGRKCQKRCGSSRCATPWLPLTMAYLSVSMPAICQETSLLTVPFVLGCVHSSFVHPETPADAKRRESIEMRALVLHYPSSG